jgi:hypothetical protein
MDKIKELLKQLNASPELTESIVKTLDAYKAQVQAEADQAYQARIEKAKAVCLEEVAQAKAEMARKIEVFLEAKNVAITRDIQKQAAIGESESIKTLRGIKNLVEGVKNDGASGENQAAVSEEIKNLRVTVARLQEREKSLQEQVSRTNAITVKALKRNKILEDQLAEGKGTTVSESTQKPATAKSTTLGAAKTPSATPKTTRQTMTESQVKAPAGQPQNDIASIAAGLDETPAFVR